MLWKICKHMIGYISNEVYKYYIFQFNTSIIVINILAFIQISKICNEYITIHKITKYYFLRG